jgi:hypothetical protein
MSLLLQLLRGLPLSPELRGLAGEAGVAHHTVRPTPALAQRRRQTPSAAAQPAAAPLTRVGQ